MLARMTRAVPVLMLAAGCAQAPLSSPLPEGLLPESAHPPPPAAEDALALSDAMHRHLRDELKPLARLFGPREALLRTLFDGRRLRIEYDATQTRTAAEAFDAGAGNCLSLVLLTASLARALGETVVFQVVEGVDGWSLAGDFAAYSGHVNLRLGGGPGEHAGRRWDTQVVVDFMPVDAYSSQRTRAIDEATVLGLYLHNRAAEALAAGRTDEAAAWVRAALAQAPGLAAAWNTAALVHLRRGDAARAERTLAHALAAEPRNTRVLGNLAALLATQGRSAEAAVLRARLAALEPVTPFAAYREGRAAMDAGRWAEARAAFARELARDPDYHEFHFWMAQAEARLGNAPAARRHLALALENAPSPPQQALYGAKLQRLQAARLP